MLHIGYIESSEEFNDYELFDQDNEVEYNISNDSESDDDDNKNDSDKNDRSSDKNERSSDKNERSTDSNTNNYSIHDHNHKNNNDNDTNYKCVDKIDFEKDHISKTDLLRIDSKE